MTDLFFQGQCEKSRTTSGPEVVFNCALGMPTFITVCECVYALEVCLPARSVTHVGPPVYGEIDY